MVIGEPGRPFAVIQQGVEYNPGVNTISSPGAALLMILHQALDGLTERGAAGITFGARKQEKRKIMLNLSKCFMALCG